MDYESKLAARYYSKLAEKKGKLFYPKTDDRIMDKVHQKYGRYAFTSEDFYKTLLENNIDVRPVLEYLKKVEFGIGEVIIERTSGNTLVKLSEDFKEVYKNNAPMLSKYVVKCILDNAVSDQMTFVNIINDIVKLNEKSENKKQGYNFCTEMDLLFHLTNNDDKNIKSIVIEFKNERKFDENSVRDLLNDLLNVDYKITSKALNNLVATEEKAEEFMYLIEDCDAMEELMKNSCEISNPLINQKLSLEWERYMFDGLYKECFDQDNEVKFNTFNKETILSAIDLNVEFLCKDYVKTYKQDPCNELLTKKLYKAGRAISYLLCETKDIIKMEQIYKLLDDENPNLLQDIEDWLHCEEANELLYFSQSSLAEANIEFAFLNDANSYATALELEKKTVNLKINNELVEKAVYNLVRFPNEELLKDEENAKIIFELNNEFAKKRMEKKANIDKK